MKKIIPLISLLWMAHPATAKALAPHQLLPADTVAMITAPNANALRDALKTFPLTQFWNDPAMAGFVAVVEKSFEEKFLAPMRERAGGENPGEFLMLAQGQVTIAFTLPPKGKQEPGILLLIDSGKKADALAKKIDEARAKLREKDRKIVERDIRGVDFYSVKRPEGDGAPRRRRPEFHVGLSGTLLVAGNNPDEIEKLLLRQAGGGTPALEKHTAFARQFKAQFRDASVYGWLDFATVLETIVNGLDEAEAPGDAPLQPNADQILGALGFKDLKSISFSLSDDLYSGELFLEVPERGRRGLFAMMTPDAESVAPPPFVGANVASFTRLRYSPAKIWKSIEDILQELSPEAGQMIAFLEKAMQAKDPQFKLKEGFIEIFSNDFISIAMPAKGGELEDITSQPTIYMIASKKPALTLKAIRNLISFASPDVPKERKFLGRTIYSYELLAALGGGGDDAQKIHLTTSAGYLVISLYPKMLEDFLRGPEDDNLRPLSDLPGLKKAAAQVGGLKSGVLAYDDGKEIFRSAFRVLRNNPDAINQIEEILPPWRGGDPVDFSWLKFKLLPEFKKVEKYFPIALIGLTSSADGLSFKAHSPPLKN